MPADFISITFQQRARLSTTADALPHAAVMQAAASSHLSKFGRGKWAAVGTAAIALGTAAAVASMQPDEKTRAAQASAKQETDRRYQELLNSYGSGESLEDLQKAVEGYEGRRG